jgi:Ni,Fe-hydrogenase maturation factor
MLLIDEICFEVKNNININIIIIYCQVQKHENIKHEISNETEIATKMNNKKIFINSLFFLNNNN